MLPGRLLMHDHACTQVAFFAQAHLDEPLPLSRLASVAELSPHYLQRVFTQVMGESPAAYVRRLRLEKAAFRLLLHQDPIVQIAFDCGFKSHETMTRAFRRRFGLAPSQYRQRQQFAMASELRRRGASCSASSAGYRLSPTRVRTLNPVNIAYIRSVGPYESVDPGLWQDLIAWSARQSYSSSYVLLGIGHDAPGITAPAKLRFDACISVPPGALSGQGIQVGLLPALQCAVTTHVGPYHTLPEAYGDIFERVMNLPNYAMVGLPAIEIYRDSMVLTDRPISCTDIHLPVLRR